MDGYIHGGFLKTEYYDHSVNINPLGMPENVKEAVKAAAEDCEAYPEYDSHTLRQTIAEKEGVQSDNIVCGNGVSELIMAVVNAIGPGNAAILKPTFSGYKRALKTVGARISEYNDIHEMTEKVTDKVDIIFICNPNNPTGEYIPKEDIRKLLKKVPAGAMVVTDESFLDFTDRASTVDMIVSYVNLIVLKAFTKFHSMAGVRLGYMCADKQVCERVRSHLPEWNVSLIAQKAGIAALRDVDRKRKTNETVSAERAFLTEELKKRGLWVSDSETNFVLVRYEKGGLAEAFAERGISVRDCSDFSGLDKRFIRVSVGMHEDNERLIGVLDNIIS
ncbi:MAG: threonine-phosphate decarboxylase CobD [Lachnospiraceae bacterium]|nr:threonine-phosphate decarboxylase CobD [Lachnospiraceae bacterium]